MGLFSRYSLSDSETVGGDVMVDRKWLDSLRVGDTVYISQSYGLPPLKKTVSRITNTQIIIPINERADWRFRKRDGHEINSDVWRSQYLIKPSLEVEKRVRISSLQNKAILLKGKISIPDDESSLLSLIDFLSRFVKEDTHG
jgi:hypothetical protein